MGDYYWQLKILRFFVDVKFPDFVNHTENLNSTNQKSHALNFANSKF